MALTNILSLAIVDDNGGRKTIPIYFPAGPTLAEVQGAADEIVPLIAAMIDGAIVDVSVTFALTIAGGPYSASASQVERGALLNFSAANTVYKHALFIPTAKDTSFADDAVVNADAVLAVTSVITGGFGAGDVLDPSDRYGNDLVDYLAGSKRFRK